MPNLSLGACELGDADLAIAVATNAAGAHESSPVETRAQNPSTRSSRRGCHPDGGPNAAGHVHSGQVVVSARPVWLTMLV